MDSHVRSIAKAISYRLGGSAITGAIVYLLGGHKIALSASVAGLDIVAKVGLYFLHERMWNHIDFGRDEVSVPAKVSSL